MRLIRCTLPRVPPSRENAEKHRKNEPCAVLRCSLLSRLPFSRRFSRRVSRSCFRIYENAPKKQKAHIWQNFALWRVRLFRRDRGKGKRKAASRKACRRWFHIRRFNKVLAHNVPRIRCAFMRFAPFLIIRFQKQVFLMFACGFCCIYL